MKLIGWVLAAVVCAVSMTGSLASSWEYYGNTRGRQGDTACFYDSESVQLVKNGLVRVWAKCFDQGHLSKFADNPDKMLTKVQTEIVAQRLAASDRPKYLQIPAVARTFKPISSNPDAMDLVGASIFIDVEELLVNTTPIKEEVSMLSEFNCAQRTLRPISTTVFSPSGKLIKHLDNMQVEPLNIPPDSNAQWLSIMVCPVN